jgi:hypothetical protein
MNGSICLIIVVASTLKTNDQSPFSSLFQNVNPKLWTQMKEPTLKRGEKVNINATPTIRVTIKNLALFGRSQCMNLYSLLTLHQNAF